MIYVIMAASSDKPLTEVELVHCLEKLASFPVTIDNLRSPTPQFMESIFECVMKDMMINVDAARQEPWKANLVIEHREGYEDVLPFITFFSLARQIMEIAGVTDFGIKDLTEPKRKRTKKILFHLMVLWKHVLLKMGRYRDIEAKCQEENKCKAKIKDDLKNMQEKYQELVSNRIDDEKREKYLKERAAKEEMLSHYCKERESFQSMQQNIKTDIAHEQRDINDLDLQIVSEQEKLEELENQILPSPSRFANEIEELKQKVVDEDLKILDTKKSVKEKYQEKEVIQSKLDLVKRTISDVTQLSETLQLFREEVMSIAELQKLYLGKTADLKSKQGSLEKMKEKIYLCEQKMAKIHLQHKTQLEHVKKLYAMNEESVNKEKSAYRTLKAEEDRVQNRINEITAEIEAQQKEKTEIRDRVMKDMEPLQKRMLDYIAECNRDIDGAFEDLQKLKQIFDETE